MQAGTLRHPATIVTPSESRVAGGNVSYDYGDAAQQRLDLDVSIRTLSGRELEEAAATHGEVTHEIRLRYADGVGTKSRVLARDRTFEVVSADNVDERDRELVLTCIERGV